MLSARSQRLRIKEGYVFGPDDTKEVSKSRLGFTSYDELATCAKAAGSYDIGWFGDWYGSPFLGASDAEIVTMFYAPVSFSTDTGKMRRSISPHIECV
jgi:hypothetical protein